jgi:hypothetical protein
MYEALVRCDLQELDAVHAMLVGDVEYAVANLREFFRVCVEHGLGLVGWW